jgi:hypothetical protein
MGWPASTRANFRRKFSCTYSPPIAPIAASAYTHRLLYHAYFLAGGHRTPRQPHVLWPEAIAARWSCGPHVTPASNRRRRCRAGVDDAHPQHGHFGDVPPMLRPLFTSYFPSRCAAHVAITSYFLLFTFYSLLPIPLCRPCCDHTIPHCYSPCREARICRYAAEKARYERISVDAQSPTHGACR